MTFETIFAADRANLERVLVDNPLEQNHQRRCMTLAAMVNWLGENAATELGQLMGLLGVLRFDQITKRVAQSLKAGSEPHWQDPATVLAQIMWIHDLGKYDSATDSFSGTSHEARSGEIVAKRGPRLMNELGWHPESVSLLTHLARYHGELGIMRLGGCSIVYLSPLLADLASYPQEQQRLFLDLLILLNCCDAGASGDFAKQHFYLDESRIIDYCEVADELLAVANEHPDVSGQSSQARLLQRATTFERMVSRVQKIVSGGNLLSMEREVAAEAMAQAIHQGWLDPVAFALTRYDHEIYVFEPMLVRLSNNQRTVASEVLAKVLRLMGLMCDGVTALTILNLRDKFSMKADLREKNRARFDALCHAVGTADVTTMVRLVRE